MSTIIHGPLDDVGNHPPHWITEGRARVDSSVAKLFEKAARDVWHSDFPEQHAERAVRADARRRAIAYMIDAPLFPEAWGTPSAKYWIVQNADSEQEVTFVRPAFGQKSLTVWRFADFEATATFNVWWAEGFDDDEGFGGGIRFRKSPPMGWAAGDWEEAGPTDNYSTLWRRPLIQKAARTEISEASDD